MAAMVWPSVALSQTAGPPDGSDPAPVSESTSSATPRDGSQNGTTWNPTEEPIELTVPDCPGITRKIDASHLPPSIYPKPTCGGGGTVTTPTPIDGLGQPTGEFGTGTGAPEAGTLFWAITGGKIYDISQGYGLTDFGTGNPDYSYCDDYGTPGHCGVDISTPIGTQLFTPVAGRVICAGTNVTVDSAIDACTAFDSDAGIVGERGRFQIELSNGDMLLFGHMSKITVKAGQQLAAGTPVGLSGIQGTGAHVHVEYRHRVADGWTTYDPREILNVPVDGAPQPTPTPVAQLSESSKVAAATTTGSSMEALMQKYGFYAPDGQSGLDFAKDATNFGIERDLAIKYAPVFDISPEMVVWWTWAETSGNHDSYNYSNCGDQTHEVDINCSAIGPSGVISWQLGYGQQFSGITNSPLLKKAFAATHGDPSNAALVQQVGQNVLAKSSINKTFPLITVDQILTGTSSTTATQMNYWAYTLGRDPAISVYLLAAAIRGDLGSGSVLYRDIAFGWGSYYQEHWQTYSNVMNDVVINWNLAPGSGSGECAPSTTNPSGSCSTIPDSLQGMTAQEFTDKVNAHLADFKKIAECGNVPWQMMVAISMREVGLDVDFRGPGAGGALGPWQIDPSGPLYGQVDPYNFVEAGCAVAKVELQEKAQSGPVGRALTPDMNPDNHDDEVSIKDAFFAYNGRGGWESNVAKGCTPAIDGHPDWNFDCSAYVMNNMDENHRDMCINGTFCDGNDGTWKVFYKLYHSTYDASGKILVYGGQCNLSTGVVNGIALPTAANIAITSHFFEPQGGGTRHIGIDIANAEGAAVFAIADGDIVNSGWDAIGGYYVLQHVPAGAAGNTAQRWVYYGHLAPDGLPAPSSQVKAGQQIGATGPHLVMRGGVLVSNGIQTAPHLHFDIRTTTSGAEDPSIHVNPCSLDQFKQGYPSLDCGTWGSLGATWK